MLVTGRNHHDQLVRLVQRNETGSRLGNTKIQPYGACNEDRCLTAKTKRCGWLRLVEPRAFAKQRNRVHRVESDMTGFSDELGAEPARSNQTPNRMRLSASDPMWGHHRHNDRQRLGNIAIGADRRRRKLIVRADTNIDRAFAIARTNTRHFEAVDLPQPNTVVGDDIETSADQLGGEVRALRWRRDVRNDRGRGRNISAVRLPDLGGGVSERLGRVGEFASALIDDQVGGRARIGVRPNDRGAEHTAGNRWKVNPSFAIRDDGRATAEA